MITHLFFWHLSLVIGHGVETVQVRDVRQILHVALEWSRRCRWGGRPSHRTVGGGAERGSGGDVTSSVVTVVRVPTHSLRRSLRHCSSSVRWRGSYRVRTLLTSLTGGSNAVLTVMSWWLDWVWRSRTPRLCRRSWAFISKWVARTWWMNRARTPRIVSRGTWASRVTGGSPIQKPDRTWASGVERIWWLRGAIIFQIAGVILWFWRLVRTLVAGTIFRRLDWRRSSRIVLRVRRCRRTLKVSALRRFRRRLNASCCSRDVFFIGNITIIIHVGSDRKPVPIPFFLQWAIRIHCLHLRNQNKSN